MLLWDSQQHLRQSSVKWMSSNSVDLPKYSVPSMAVGTSAVCCCCLWGSKEGRSQTPTELSQVTGMKQSWTCRRAVSQQGFICRLPTGEVSWNCMTGCWQSEEKRLSPFGIMNSFICFASPRHASVVNELTALIWCECQQRRRGAEQQNC